MSTADVTVLSWTSTDPRESSLFSSWGVLYRFSTETVRGKTITTLWRAIRSNKEDRVGRLEWSSDGGLGRALIGRNTLPMADLCRRAGTNTTCWSGPDGFQYTWSPATTGGDVMLRDPSGVVIALYRRVPTKRFNIGDVVGELHFFNNAGAGVVLHPPMMDLVVLSSMLNRMVV